MVVFLVPGRLKRFDDDDNDDGDDDDGGEGAGAGGAEGRKEKEAEAFYLITRTPYQGYGEK